MNTNKTEMEQIYDFLSHYKNNRYVEATESAYTIIFKRWVELSNETYKNYQKSKKKDDKSEINHDVADFKE